MYIGAVLIAYLMVEFGAKDGAVGGYGLLKYIKKDRARCDLREKSDSMRNT